MVTDLIVDELVPLSRIPTTPFAQEERLIYGPTVMSTFDLDGTKDEQLHERSGPRSPAGIISNPPGNQRWVIRVIPYSVIGDLPSTIPLGVSEAASGIPSPPRW